jgi:hypothetical protein
MAPSLFHLDYERVGEALTAVIVLAFFLERSLSLLFEHRYYTTRFNESGLKEPIAFLGALAICRQWQFDAIGITVLAEQPSFLGYVLTAGLIAGGSKAALKLFHDVIGSMSVAEKQRRALNAASQSRRTAPEAAQPVPVPVLATETR